MRFVIQRVRRASVEVADERVGEIGRGFLVLIGVTHGDDVAVADKMIKKMLGLRIFEDENGKTNLSLADVDGSLLLVSQFTLYADCRKGNRPSFTNAAAPDAANELYEYVVAKCREKLEAAGGAEMQAGSDSRSVADSQAPAGGAPRVQTGIFGADMKVELLNDGPFTVILDSAEL